MSFLSFSGSSYIGKIYTTEFYKSWQLKLLDQEIYRKEKEVSLEERREAEHREALK